MYKSRTAPTKTRAIVVQGDAQRIVARLPPNFFALVCTSPPYNVGRGYDIYKDTRPLSDYLEFLEEVFANCAKALMPGGHMCINIANVGRDPYIPLAGLLLERLGKYLQLRGEIIWDKGFPGRRFLPKGWRNPDKPPLRDLHEYILVFRKVGHRPKGIPDITKREFLEFSGSMWRVPSKIEVAEHPAQFPEQIPHRCIKLFTFKGEWVLDPFAGVGTTLIAASKLGRNSLGVEISPSYVEKTIKRLRAAGVVGELLADKELDKIRFR